MFLQALSLTLKYELKVPRFFFTRCQRSDTILADQEVKEVLRGNERKKDTTTLS